MDELASDCVSCDNLNDFYELEEDLLKVDDVHDSVFVYYVPFNEIQHT